MYPGFLDLIDSVLNVNIFDWFYKLLAHMYMFPLSITLNDAFSTVIAPRNRNSAQKNTLLSHTVLQLFMSTFCILTFSEVHLHNV